MSGLDGNLVWISKCVGEGFLFLLCEWLNMGGWLDFQSSVIK